MIEDNGVIFTNLNGQQLALNNDIWPLKSFEIEGSMRGQRIEKMEEPGEWPTRTQVGALLIHCGGDLLKDTSDTYIAERMRAMNILVPAGVIEQERRMGTLTVKYNNFEPLINDCTLDDYPMLPMQALYPSVTEYTMTFRIFAGYMIGISSGRKYVL
jgi:hypothetical protein